MIDDEDNDREGKKRRNELNLNTNYYYILFRHNKNLVVEIIYFRFPRQHFDYRSILGRINGNKISYLVRNYNQMT